LNWFMNDRGESNLLQKQNFMGLSKRFFSIKKVNLILEST
jgi:hypothetical protein